MIVFVCSLIGFILFLYLVQRGTLQQQEEALALFVIKSRTPALTRMMLFFTNFGKALPTIILLLLLYVFPATQTILAPKAAASVLLVSAFAYLIKTDRPQRTTKRSSVSRRKKTTASLVPMLLLLPHFMELQR